MAAEVTDVPQARHFACSLLVLVFLVSGPMAAHAQAAPDASGSTAGTSTGTAAGSTGTAAASTGGTAPAGSQDAQARQLFEAGRQAFGEGRFEDALRLFRSAYAASPRAGLLYNIGSAADRLRHDQEALQAFRSYLEQAPPDAANRAEVRRRVEVLQAEQARVPTPEQTARAGSSASAGSTSATTTHHAASSDGGLLSRWWFWTIVGAVVVGAVVGGVLIATSSGGTEGPAPGIDWNVAALGRQP